MIKITKHIPGHKAKDLEKVFTSFEEAESYMNSNILPTETLFKHITYVVNPIPNITKARVYIFLDENDLEVYSYRIIQYA